MEGWPTPDPSASLTAWQSYIVQRDDALQLMAHTGALLLVIASMLVLFALGAIAVAVAYRRR